MSCYSLSIKCTLSLCMSDVLSVAYTFSTMKIILICFTLYAARLTKRHENQLNFVTSCLVDFNWNVYIYLHVCVYMP